MCCLLSKGILEPLTALYLGLNLLGNVGEVLLQVVTQGLPRGAVGPEKLKLLLSLLDHLLRKSKTSLCILNLLSFVSLILRTPLMNLSGWRVSSVKFLESLNEGLMPYPGCLTWPSKS
uniref:Uncharacterized protein n=1 Tax=Helicotheca tamesis TaxID=374047 RepID=A0A7S2GUN7_9STRA